MTVDYLSLFGTAITFWLLGFLPAYLMLKFRQGMEISIT